MLKINPKKLDIYNHILVCSLLLFFSFSCSKKEEFKVSKVTDSDTTSAIKHLSSTLCAGYTIIKPKVDILFLWDNSGSTQLLNQGTKSALNNLVYNISDRFDYRILMAPLMTDGDLHDNTHFYLMAENPSGLSSTAMGHMFDGSPDQKLEIIMKYQRGGLEKGVNRAIAILNDYKQGGGGHGVFRTNSYTLVVVMSNANDRTYCEGTWCTETKRLQFISQKVVEFSQIKSQLQSLQLRFMSIVAHSTAPGYYCTESYKPGTVYRDLSARIYHEINGGTYQPSDQAGRPYPDSYDLCTTDYLYLFDGVNSSIQSQIVKHKYNFWPITSAQEYNINFNKIKVTKSSGSVQTPLTEITGCDCKTNCSGNGFCYWGYETNFNTRYEPSSGEPYTGHLIHLLGNGRVTYPECVVVKTQTPTDYYGYIHLNSKPVVSSIELFINGKQIPQSTSDGWDYIGFKQNLNIKIKSPGEPDQPGTPAIIKSGYFLKLSGSAIFSNSSTWEIFYDPSGT